MATILDRGIDTERGDAIAANAAAMGELPALRVFIVQIKRGAAIRSTFEAMGTDSCSVTAQHADLAQEGEYLSVKPRRFGFSEEELIEADLARNTKKAQRAHALNDAHALDLQVQFQGFIGALS